MKRTPARALLTVFGMFTLLILSACGAPSAATSTTASSAVPQASIAAPATDASSQAPVTTVTTDASAQASVSASAAPSAASASAATPLNLIKMPEQIAGGRPVTITVIGKPPESQPEQLKNWNDQIARFQKLYPNVTINGSDYAYAPDTFAALVAGKQIPTLFEVYLSDPAKIIDQGIAADLSSFFDAHKLRDVFNPNVLAITSQNGKVYGIPRSAYGMGLGYNMTMLKAAGFNAPPTSWDELATMAQALTKRDAGVAGFSFISDGSAATGWQFTTIAYTLGAKQVDIVKAASDGTYTAGFAAGAPVDALKYIKDLRWKYDVLPRENLDWAKNGEALATGRAAMVVMAGDQFIWMRQTFPDVDVSQFGYAPLPAGANGKSVSLVGGNIAMVSSAASDDEKEAAVYYRLWQQFDPAEIQTGFELGKQDPKEVIGAPVLPLYVNDYQQQRAALEQRYANLPTQNYQLFRDAVAQGKVGLEPEPATAGQEYYAAIGGVVSSILTEQSTDPAATLTQAAETFQTNVLDQLVKQ